MNKSNSDLSYNAQKVSKLKLIGSKFNTQNIVNYFSLLVGGALIVLMLGVVTLLVPPARDNAKATGKHYSVHVVAGQSNALGQGAKASELPSSNLDQNIRLYWNGHNTSDGIVKLQPQPLGDGMIFGPEISLARNLSAQGTRNILMVKMSFSGSSMWQNWNSTNGNGWPLFIREVQNVLNRVESTGDTYSIDGFYWMQGESDTGPDSAPTYKGHLVKFIDDFRITFNVPEMPFIIGRIYAPNQPSIYRDTVRTSQVDVGNSKYRVRWVNTDNLPIPDGIHYSSNGQLTLGNRFFNEISPFMQAKYPSLVPSNSYTDVGNTSLYKSAIDWSVSRKIVFPYSATIFKPNEAVARAKIVQFIWRAKGSPRATASSNFTDVSPVASYKPALDWAKQDGIITGDSNNKFYPDNVITRQQYVDMLWKYSGAKTPNPNTAFSDVYVTSKPYKPAINWSSNYAIVPTSSNKYLPTSYVTRQQAAYFLYNLSIKEEAWLNRNTAPVSVLF